jgi:sortase A
MLTGGIVAYPTLQDYLAPPDAQSLEFSVTVPPPPTTVALQPIATAVVLQPTATATAPPPITLPPTEVQTGEEATPEATPEPTPTPSPTPTPDPASLMPTWLSIPTLDLEAPIVEVGWETQEISGQLVSSWIVPDSYAAGWHKTSAPPGQGGNVVLNGHHNIHGELFRDLEDLQPGDEIIVQAGETAHYYSVAARHILEEKGQPVEVRTKNAEFILPTEYERLTIVTCWPYTNNTHRLIIVALSTQPAPTPVPVE